MTRNSTTPRTAGRACRLAAALLLCAVVLASCGQEAVSEESQPAVDVVSLAAQSAIDAAAENRPLLDLTDDVVGSEMLNARTGAITNLDQVITGDRPVLLWYWSPN